ncbi:MAG: methyltransferase domain-containing protein [Bacteroidetes bacterium]|nr:methyltransferase domain-containing protein [Bacteroidota bacterium]
MLKRLEKEFRKYFPKQLKSKHTYLNALKGLEGIEIGGPSLTFTKKGLLPVYKVIKSLDGCNFSANTVWEGNLAAGKTYHYENGRPKGYQFITEGFDLAEVRDNNYDFLLSCHNLEHFANPIKALFEWKRVVKPGGYLLLVLPNKEKTFDHLRPVTDINHIWDDYRKNMPEADETHFEEVIALHDYQLPNGNIPTDDLIKKVYSNNELRCVHHHVFDRCLAEELVKSVNFDILNTELIQINIFILARNIK